MSWAVATTPGGPAIRGTRDATIVLIGCGGTGGFLAEALGRLLVGRDGELYLVDPDTVEERNLGRQNFGRRNLGRPKARALADRLAAGLGRPVGYAVAGYDRDVHAAVFRPPARLRLVVGAVDNPAARRAIAATLDRPGPDAQGVWWLDAGNLRNSGQVLLGDAIRPDGLRGAFDRAAGVCRALPAPSLQRPDLLEAPPLPAEPQGAPDGGPLDCAAAVAADQQGRTINLLMAALVAGLVDHLLAGTCHWSGVYADADAGQVRYVPAEPAAVARQVGLHPNAVCPPRPTPQPNRPLVEVLADDAGVTG